MAGMFVAGFWTGICFMLLVLLLVALRWPRKEKKAGSHSLETNTFAKKQG